MSAQQGRKGEAEQAGDPATDQVVRISEAPTVYLPTGQGGKLVVTGFPDRFRRFGSDGRALLEDTAARWGVAQRRVSGELYPLFLANQRRGLRSGYDAGDLSPYAALLLGAGLYDRMFERRDLPLRRSYAVSVLVDGSASMLQPRPGPEARKSPWAMAAATLGAWTLAHLCNELQIEFEVALFNRAFPASDDDSERQLLHQAGRRHRRAAPPPGRRRRSSHPHRQPLPGEVVRRPVALVTGRDGRVVLHGGDAGGGGPGGPARSPSWLPRCRCSTRRPTWTSSTSPTPPPGLPTAGPPPRLLVVLADGMTRGSVEALAASVDAVEHAGATVLGIGIGDTTVQAAYSPQPGGGDTRRAGQGDGGRVRSTLHRTLMTMGGTTWWSAPTELIAV